MKNKFIFSMLVLFTTISVFAQNSKMETEQAIIQKVIEDETNWFNQRNFEKWAECVAHDPMTYYSWTTPFSGPHSVYEGKGWTEISTFVKEYMSNNKPRKENQKKTNYSFKITDKIAYVTFDEDDGSGTRVLEKINGNWRIVRMDAIASSAFKNMHKIYALNRMCGTWNMDMSTYKKEGGGSWTLLSSEMKIEKNSTGINIKEASNFHDKNGKLRKVKDETFYSVDMGTGKVGILSSSFYSNSQWTWVGSGEGDIDKDGVLSFVGHQVGNSEKAIGSMQLSDKGTLDFSVEVFNEKGEKVFASSYSMINAAEPLAIRP